MLNQALVEAFKAGKSALEEQTTNIGPFEAALEKIRTAQTHVQNKGDQGIVQDTVQYRTDDGENVTINNSRDKLTELSLQIHVAKQEHILQEKKSHR